MSIDYKSEIAKMRKYLVDTGRFQNFLDYITEPKEIARVNLASMEPEDLRRIANLIEAHNAWVEYTSYDDYGLLMEELVVYEDVESSMETQYKVYLRQYHAALQAENKHLAVGSAITPEILQYLVETGFIGKGETK